MSKDYQKTKLYRAEQDVRAALDFANSNGASTIEVFGSTLVMPNELKFGSLDAIKLYIKRLEKHEAITDYWFPPVVLVEHSRKQTKRATTINGRIIVMPNFDKASWAWREIVLLHEYAHVLTYGDQHGPRFAGVFLYLVETFIGMEAALLLRTAMHKHKVDFTTVKEQAA